MKIRWAILTGGEPEPLAGRDLTLEISSGNRVRTTLSFVADGNVAAFVFEGSEQRYVGPYAVTMWENLGKEGQTVVDRCDAFCLVARSCEEAESGSAEDPGLEIESLDLGTSNFEAGVPGASAYELFKKYNPDSELTEEEYAEAPVQAAGAALAMVEQLEETEAAMKRAEQLRKQAEQGREASEQARATAEQGRVAAEQQRALAEQTRVTNESARQTAEAGRQAAETKREENTSEAIRNCETATQEAEDEAARVRTLADNPPKIVEVEGAKYWAFWDEETGQYVVSENRADVGDAVLFSPQTLTPQQQEQARANIGVNNPYSPSYLEIESPFEYDGRVTIGCMAIDGDIMYLGVFGGGYFAYDYIKQDIVWISQTMNAASSGNNKQMVVKDEYLYVIGDGNKRIEKYNKKTGELIASRIDDATVQYGQMYISNINGNIYYHSPITKTLYLLNEEDLTANPSGIYDGVIEAIDDNWIDCICIYVSDNHIIWLDFDFQETYSVDATDVTNISSYAYKRIRCIKNKRFVVVAAGASNSATNYAAIVQNNGANFSNSYTRNLLTIGEIFCSAVDGIKTAETRFNIVATNGIIGGRNGLIYSDAPLSPMPFTYGSAFNIRNKLYLCYCEGSTLKLRIY